MLWQSILTYQLMPPSGNPRAFGDPHPRRGFRRRCRGGAVAAELTPRVPCQPRGAHVTCWTWSSSCVVHGKGRFLVHHCPLTLYYFTYILLLLFQIAVVISPGSFERRCFRTYRTSPAWSRESRWFRGRSLGCLKAWVMLLDEGRSWLMMGTDDGYWCGEAEFNR